MHKVPFAALSVSALNVRQGAPAPETLAGLKASIATVGVVNPLTVRLRKPEKSGDPEGYEVIAGRRRYYALKALADEKHPSMDAKFTVPVRIIDVDDAEAIKISLDENVEREALDPLAEADAYAKLVKADGGDPQQVAATFAVPLRRVLQRLAFAELPTFARKAYEDKKIGVAELEALASLDKRELVKWNEAFRKGEYWTRNAQSIRSRFRDDKIPTGVALFDPQTAGVRVITDLFGEDSWFESAEEFWKHQNAAVRKMAEDLTAKGYGTVEIADYDSVNTWQLRPWFQPEERRSKNYEKTLAKLEKEYSALCDKAEEEGLDSEEFVRLDALEEQINELQTWGDLPTPDLPAEIKSKLAAWILVRKTGGVTVKEAVYDAGKYERKGNKLVEIKRAANMGKPLPVVREDKKPEKKAEPKPPMTQDIFARWNAARVLAVRFAALDDPKLATSILIAEGLARFAGNRVRLNDGAMAPEMTEQREKISERIKMIFDNCGLTGDKHGIDTKIEMEPAALVQKVLEMTDDQRGRLLCAMAAQAIGKESYEMVRAPDPKKPAIADVLVMTVAPHPRDFITLDYDFLSGCNADVIEDGLRAAGQKIAADDLKAKRIAKKAAVAKLQTAITNHNLPLDWFPLMKKPAQTKTVEAAKKPASKPSAAKVKKTTKKKAAK